LSPLAALNELVRSAPHLIQDTPAYHLNRFSCFGRGQMLCFTY